MIIEGLKLMLAGMFTVYVFLAALLVMIKISARFFGGSPQSRETAAYACKLRFQRRERQGCGCHIGGGCRIRVKKITRLVSADYEENTFSGHIIQGRLSVVFRRARADRGFYSGG